MSQGIVTIMNERIKYINQKTKIHNSQLFIQSVPELPPQRKKGVFE
jgi:hypothetical protein